MRTVTIKEGVLYDVFACDFCSRVEAPGVLLRKEPLRGDDQVQVPEAKDYAMDWKREPGWWTTTLGPESKAGDIHTCPGSCSDNNRAVAAGDMTLKDLLDVTRGRLEKMGRAT